MKVLPSPTAAAPARANGPQASATASFTDMIAGRDGGASARDHRAMSFLERGVLSTSKASFRSESSTAAAGIPSDATAREPAPARSVAAPIMKDSIAQRRGVASPARHSAAAPKVPPGRDSASPAPISSSAPLPSTRPLAAQEEAPPQGEAAALERRLRQRPAAKARLSVRLEDGDTGLIAVITAEEAASCVDEIAEETFRFAAEQGLRLRAIVLNGETLSRPQLR